MASMIVLASSGFAASLGRRIGFLVWGLLAWQVSEHIIWNSLKTPCCFKGRD